MTLSIKYATKIVRNYVSNDIDLVQPIRCVVSKDRVANKPKLRSIYKIYLYFNIFVASFESSGDAAERLTAHKCTLLIGAHGPELFDAVISARDSQKWNLS